MIYVNHKEIQSHTANPNLGSQSELLELCNPQCSNNKEKEEKGGRYIREGVNRIAVYYIGNIGSYLDILFILLIRSDWKCQINNTSNHRCTDSTNSSQPTCPTPISSPTGSSTPTSPKSSNG